MPRFSWKKISLLSIALGFTSASHAEIVTLYTFQESLEGWTNQTAPTTGPTGYVNSRIGGFGTASTIGLMPNISDGGNVDDAHDLPLWIISPEFIFDSGAEENEISFQLWGGVREQSISEPIEQLLSLLDAGFDPGDVPSGSTASGGFQGMALERVSDGEFILTAVRSRTGQGPARTETFTWDAATINAAIAGDDASETYRLSLIDTAHGGWGWIGADNVSITTTVIIPEPSSLALIGMGGLLMLRRRRS